ncbi:MAG: DUF2497 domain-containing protein [Pseudomonadota bacterium]
MSNQDAESQQEPSMEEILASIRRIISEDDEPGAEAADGDAPQEDASEEEAAAPPPPPPPEPEPEPPAPEMDAADEPPVADEPPPPPTPVEEAPPPPPPPPPPVPQDDVLDLTNVVKEAPKAESDPYIDLNRPAMPAHNIVSDQPAMSTSEYFARLAIIAQERGQLGGSITVEEMARELMRPMLQAWLDENLPRIVERQVQNEIERIVRKSHDL